jgi:hypothetical protein
MKKDQIKLNAFSLRDKCRIEGNGFAVGIGKHELWGPAERAGVVRTKVFMSVSERNSGGFSAESGGDSGFETAATKADRGASRGGTGGGRECADAEGNAGELHDAETLVVRARRRWPFSSVVRKAL